MTRRALTPALMLVAGLVAAAVPADWKQAMPGYELSLPRDHVSHPEYRLEWWYYTGNVRTHEGRRFGYQLTFFRIGVDAAPQNPSRFAVRDLFVAHAALTDVDGHRYLSGELLNRAGVDVAGASTTSLHVWNQNWSAVAEGHQHRLRASLPSFSVDLDLEEVVPPVLHGDRGYSRKGGAAGNASEDDSLTRMPTAGAVTLDGARFEVAGDSWMDHEFGTTFLESAQQGWDWLSVQLDDKTDVMLYRFRRVGGAPDPWSSGTVASPASPPRHLSASDFTLTPGRAWTSPATGGRYPVEWTVEAPSEALRLTVAPVLDSQEFVGARTGVRYWEGAIDVVGTRRGRAVRGRGYLEMTGYVGTGMGEMLKEEK